MRNQKFKIPSTCWILIVFVLLSGLNKVSAQSDADAKKWEFNADVYLMFPYMNGETGIGNNITAPVDANPGDIFDKLQMAGMFDFEARTDKWAITTDFVYMDLNQDVTPGTIAGTVIESGDVSAKQLIWETAGLYRVLPCLEVGVGGRMVNLDMEIDLNPKADVIDRDGFSKSGSKTWVDPILITRFTKDIAEKWLFQFRGDLGGFGMASDFTWQLQAYAGYRFTKVFQLTAGYRILGIDYDKGTDADRFIYNVETSGPVVKLGFNF